MVNTYKQDEEKTKFSLHNLKRMGKFIKPYKKELLSGFIYGIIGSISVFSVTKIMAYAIDNTFIKKNFMELILLTFICLGLLLLSAFLYKVKRDKMIIVLDNVSKDIKIAIFKKLQELPNNYYDTKSHGKIYTRATSYPDEATAIMCYVFLDAISDIINLILIVIFMFSCNVKLSFVSIGLSIFLVLFFILISPLKRRLMLLRNEKKANVNAYLGESINGVKITQSFNREKKNLSILKDLENKRMGVSNKLRFISDLDWALTNMCNNVSNVIMYAIGLKFLFPAVSIGSIAAISSYADNFWSPLNYLTSSYSEIMDAMTYLEKIFELLDEDIIIKESPKSLNFNIKGNIKFNKVSFSYNNDRTILENLNLEIKSGEKIGLVGETGSGKSTILNLISRFYDVNNGEIYIDDINIKDIKLSTLRRSISMMMQENFIFGRSVYDNLVLDRKIAKEEVIKVCKSLDIHDMIMNLDNGYDTILLNNGSNMSSGERQLLCIARIMIQNPRVIIMDEATSNIDLKTEAKIARAINILTKDRTTIMVAHRISTIKNCDKIFVIKNKNVYESGNHAELMKEKGAYYKLYKEQSIL